MTTCALDTAATKGLCPASIRILPKAVRHIAEKNAAQLGGGSRRNGWMPTQRHVVNARGTLIEMGAARRPNAPACHPCCQAPKFTNPIQLPTPPSLRPQRALLHSIPARRLTPRRLLPWTVGRLRRTDAHLLRLEEKLRRTAGRLLRSENYLLRLSGLLLRSEGRLLRSEEWLLRSRECLRTIILRIIYHPEPQYRSKNFQKTGAHGAPRIRRQENASTLG